eukprot:6211215-Amphidinium_carterae.1
MMASTVTGAITDTCERAVRLLLPSADTSGFPVDLCRCGAPRHNPKYSCDKMMTIATLNEIRIALFVRVC